MMAFAWAMPSSKILSTKLSPGRISQRSSQTSTPRFLSRDAKSTTNVLSSDAWLRKTFGGPAGGAFIVPSERGDGLHLDQELLLHEAIDDEQRVGRIDAVREHPRKFAQPVLHEFRDLLRVHEVGGELNDVAPAGAGGFQRLLDLAEHARALRV